MGLISSFEYSCSMFYYICILFTYQFSTSHAIDIDAIEAEIENESDIELDFDTNWKKDFHDLERALDDDSIRFENIENDKVAAELSQVRSGKYTS